MRILFVGGTGNLSWECSLRALADGHELWHLNRGSGTRPALEGVRSLVADVEDEEAAARALGNQSFDAVVDFIAYRPEHIQRDLRLFRSRAGHYVFISSASAYRKPAVHHVITESTPLANPYWDYSRGKIACEAALWREAGDLPFTIVRPSHTYGLGWIPTAWNSSDYTVPARMLAGREIPVHGDGQGLWTLTHARDFAVGLVGLLGNPAAMGEAVQICGDEALTWDSIHRAIAAALGVECALVHVPSEFIAAVDPEMGQHFLGDKSWSSVFDCSKLKRLVPAFRASVPFHAGVRESVEWYRADPTRRRTNARLDAVMDAVLDRWKRGMAAALAD